MKPTNTPNASAQAIPASLDMANLGVRMAARNDELMAQTAFKVQRAKL